MLARQRSANFRQASLLLPVTVRERFAPKFAGHFYSWRFPMRTYTFFRSIRQVLRSVVRGKLDLKALTNRQRTVISCLFVFGVSMLVIPLAVGTQTSNTIKGCVNVKTGALRIDDDCRLHESPIVWNIAGPQGTQGERGADGAQGPQGPKGDKGDQGA